MASSYTLDTLIADLKNSTYVPKTQAELAEAANKRYQAAYDQKRLEAQQAADMNQLALDRQLNSLGTAYGRQKEAAAQSYAQAYSQANRQAVSHGMQRSSFNNAALSGIAVAGSKAQQEIADNEQLARTGLTDQKTLLDRQLGQQLSQYNAGQAADTLSYLDQLESQEHDRQTAAGDRQNSLRMQMYQLSAAKDQQDAANAQWQKQYDESLRQYDTNLAEQIRQYNESLTQQKNQSSLDEKYRQDQYAQNKSQFELSLAQQQKQLEEEMRQFDVLHPKKSGSTYKPSGTDKPSDTDKGTGLGGMSLDQLLAWARAQASNKRESIFAYGTKATPTAKVLMQTDKFALVDSMQNKLRQSAK